MHKNWFDMGHEKAGIRITMEDGEKTTYTSSKSCKAKIFQDNGNSIWVEINNINQIPK